jgi:Leucine Rich repeat
MHDAEISNEREISKTSTNVVWWILIGLLCLALSLGIIVLFKQPTQSSTTEKKIRRNGSYASVDKDATLQEFHRFLAKETGLEGICLESGIRNPDDFVLLLENHSTIEFVDLWSTVLSDQALISLAKIPNLKAANLSNTLITDAGLRNLQNSWQLETLDLSYTLIDGSGLDYLSSLPKLKILLLNGTRLSEESWKNLQGFVQLEKLALSGSLFSDQGCAAVAKLHNLRELYLRDCTQLSGQGLLHFKNSKKLKKLFLGQISKGSYLQPLTQCVGLNRLVATVMEDDSNLLFQFAIRPDWNVEISGEETAMKYIRAIHHEQSTLFEHYSDYSIPSGTMPKRMIPLLEE